MVFFVKGCILGLSVAAPVGPIGLLCIRRTLVQGRLAGFVSGLGAATADFVYACLAAFGIASVMTPLLSWQHSVQVAGGIFLLYLGAKTFTERPPDRVQTNVSGSLLACFSTTLGLTFTNPLTVLSFGTMFLALGAAESGGAFVAAGVFAGSSAWWLALAGIAGAARERLDQKKLLWLNRAAGILIAGFGIAALAHK